MSFASTLRTLVTIQASTATKDAAGQPLPSGWADLRKAWADIRYTGGLEAIRAGAVSSTVKASIRIRYSTDVDASMRVVSGTKTFAVLAVLPDSGRVYVDLVCEEIT